MKQHTEQPQQPISFLTQPPPDWVMYPSLFVLAIIALVYLANPSKNAIGRARMATKAEIKKSRDRTIKELDTQRGLTLWVGMPKTFERVGNKTIFVPDPQTVMFGNASEHLAAIATTGGGKTRYFLNRLGFSAIQQDKPIIALDMKGDEEVGIATPSQADPLGWNGADSTNKDDIAPTSELAGFALEHDYEVFTIAPFFPDSHCINPIALLKSPEDLATAGQLSEALIANCAGEHEKRDFFSKAGSRLIMADILMARGLAHGADLATCHKILARLNESPKSIQQAAVTQYQKSAYDQFLGAAKSAETAGSIVATAMDVFSRFIVPEITAVFCRKTNIPIVLKKKQMLIFRIDPRYASIVTPLVAACLEIIIDRNVYAGTGFGGLLLLDELPQIKLLNLPKLMGVARSKKWSIAFGTQGKSILEMSYGKTLAGAIFENTGTIWLGKQAETETAKAYSERFGKEDVKVKSKNTGKGGGGTDSQQQRDLVPTEELMQQPPGRAVVVTPSVSIMVKTEGKKEKRVSIPYRHQFKISKHELKAMASAKKTWLRSRNEAIPLRNPSPLTNEQLEAREKLALQLLPEPAEVLTPIKEAKIPTSNVANPVNPSELWKNINALQSEFNT